MNKILNLILFYRGPIILRLIYLGLAAPPLARILLFNYAWAPLRPILITAFTRALFKRA